MGYLCIKGNFEKQANSEVTSI